jgi:hypothetical protein
VKAPSQYHHERYRTLHVAPMAVPVAKFYELPFLVWRPLKEAVDVARALTRSDSLVETLRRARIQMQVFVQAGTIHVVATAQDRYEAAEVRDDLIKLRLGFQISLYELDYAWIQMAREEGYRHLRQEIIASLPKQTGLPFQEAIRSVELWEESERVVEKHGGMEILELVTTAIVRKEKQWPAVSIA